MEAFTEEMFTINPALACLKNMLTNETRRPGLVLQLTVLPQLPVGAAEDNKQTPPQPPYVDEDKGEPKEAEGVTEQQQLMHQEDTMEPDSTFSFVDPHSHQGDAIYFKLGFSQASRVLKIYYWNWLDFHKKQPIECITSLKKQPHLGVGALGVW